HRPSGAELNVAHVKRSSPANSRRRAESLLRIDSIDQRDKGLLLLALTDHEHLDRRFDFRREPNLDLVEAELLDDALELDGFLIDGEVLLLESGDNLGRADGAVEMAFFVGDRRNRHAGALQLLGQRAKICE